MTSESSPLTLKESLECVLLIITLAAAFGIYGHHVASRLDARETDSVESPTHFIFLVDLFPAIARAIGRSGLIELFYTSLGGLVGSVLGVCYLIVRVVSKTRSRLRQIRNREAMAINSPNRER